MPVRAERGEVIERREEKPRKPKPGDGFRNREEVEFPERSLRELQDEVEESVNPDELVMVMMPRVAWDAFQGLAKKYGGSTAEAISTALKLLEKKLAEKAEED